MAATLKKIAEISGVTVATVSYALNGKAGVSKTKKKLILEVARSLNYYPNEPARTLSKKRSTSIGVLVPELHNPFSVEMFKSIENACWKAGYFPILISPDHPDDMEQGLVMFLKYRVAGIIIGGFTYKELSIASIMRLKKMNFPFVAFGSVAPMVHTDYVTIDRVACTRDAIEHLIKLGHRKIGYLCLPDTHEIIPGKLSGFRQALTEANILEHDEFMIRGFPGSLEGGYKAMRTILSRRVLPTAFFCHNDLAALGAYRAIKESKLRIPKDISIVGFDNIVESAFSDPALSTVNQPKSLIGEALVTMLLERMNDHSAPLKERIIKGNFVERGSCTVPASTQKRKK